MSFLDRFKRKASDESAPEFPAVKIPGAAAEPPPRPPDPAIQLAAATVAAGYNPDFKLPAKKEKPPEPVAAANEQRHQIILELGDFLHRIPQQYLKDQEHDPKEHLHFDVSELAERISRGQTTIPLVEIYK